MIKLILLSQKFVHNFKFSKTCDIEGKYSPVMGSEFDVELKVRNLNAFNKIKMKFLIELLPKKDFRVKFSSRESTLIGESGKAQFKFDYQLKADLFNQKVEPLGGTASILSINGKKYTGEPFPLK